MPKEIEDALSASILQTSHMPPVTLLQVAYIGALEQLPNQTSILFSVEPKAWAGRFDSDRVRTDHYPTAVRRLLAPGDGTRQYPAAISSSGCLLPVSTHLLFPGVPWCPSPKVPPHSRSGLHQERRQSAGPGRPTHSLRSPSCGRQPPRVARSGWSRG